MKSENAVLRYCSILKTPPGNALRFVVFTLIAEVPRIHGVFIIEAIIEANRAGVFVYSLCRIELNNIKIGIRRSSRQRHRARTSKSVNQRANGRNSTRRSQQILRFGFRKFQPAQKFHVHACDGVGCGESFHTTRVFPSER